MSDAAEKHSKQYAQRGREMVLVRVPADVRDRVRQLADGENVTIGFKIEQLLMKPLQDAEKSATN